METTFRIEKPKSRVAISILWGHYNLADHAYEMGRIHEADGEMQKAVECYERSLRHLREAADAADARTKLSKDRVPRRPTYEASLARVKKLLA